MKFLNPAGLEDKRAILAARGARSLDMIPRVKPARAAPAGSGAAELAAEVGPQGEFSEPTPAPTSPAWDNGAAGAVNEKLR